MSVNCFLRFLLTVMHAFTGLGAAFFCVFSLTDWSYKTCLPGLVDHLGGVVPFKTAVLNACETLVYGMVVVCLLNFASCLVINCLWKNACIMFVNLLLSIIYISFAVMGGTGIVVYYVVWCDTLERSLVGSHGCLDAVHRYDSFNNTGQMSLYKTHMEVQMASILALFPPIGIAILTYSLVMRIFAKPDSRDRRSRYIPLDDETRSLISEDNTNTSYGSQSQCFTNLPDVTREASNPFDN